MVRSDAPISGVPEIGPLHAQVGCCRLGWASRTTGRKHSARAHPSRRAFGPPQDEDSGSKLFLEPVEPGSKVHVVTAGSGRGDFSAPQPLATAGSPLKPDCAKAPSGFFIVSPAPGPAGTRRRA